MVKYKHDPFGSGLLGIVLAILAVLLFAFSSGVRASFVTVLVGGIGLLLIVGAIALLAISGLVLLQSRKEKKAKKA
jgi:protein-S-isoprenylcysteine O-methyltransferase Ste14